MLSTPHTSPYHPWDWYIYLLIYHKDQQLMVGKYTSPMDPMGTSMICRLQICCIRTYTVKGVTADMPPLETKWQGLCIHKSMQNNHRIFLEIMAPDSLIDYLLPTSMATFGSNWQLWKQGHRYGSSPYRCKAVYGAIVVGSSHIDLHTPKALYTNKFQT